MPQKKTIGQLKNREREFCIVSIPKKIESDNIKMQSKHVNRPNNLDRSVAWVTPILGRHGKLMYMEPLLGELAKRCRDFTVITSTYPADTESAPFKITISSRLRGLYWKGKNSYLVGLTFIGPSFYKKIKDTNPQVLFLVEFGLTTIYGLLFKTFNKKTKTILLVESKPVESDRIILRTLRRVIRKIITNQCDVILTNNQKGKEFLISQLNSNPNKIITSPYLISHANSSASSNSERFFMLNNTSTIKFLFVGQIIERKGLQHLIKAVKLIPKEYSDRIKIDIVGDGDYINQLLGLISQYGIKDKFQFHGRVEYSELSDFYSTAHVFIFPTLSDYRALSPFEALNAGLPIISSIHDGGNSENVIEGVNGHVCDPLDTSTFSSIITGILENPEKLYQYSLKSFEISKEYTLEKAVDNMLSAAELAMSKSH